MPKAKKTTSKRAKKKAPKKVVKKTAPVRTQRAGGKKSARRKTIKKVVKKVVRKVTKKTTRKKTSPGRAKRTGGKKISKKPPIKTNPTKQHNRKLVVAVEAECFWVHKGPILKDLKELSRAFEGMEDYQFSHHIQEQNDFANWVEEILVNKRCANALRKATTKSESLFIVNRVLKRYV